MHPNHVQRCQKINFLLAESMPRNLIFDFGYPKLVFFIGEPLVLKHTMTFLLSIIFYIFVLKVTKTLYHMFTLIGLQTKCFHVIVFKRITTPLSSMTSHVMHSTATITCNNMQNCFIHSNPFYFHLEITRFNAWNSLKTR